MADSIYIERHILLGLITSTEYLNQIRDSWEPRYLQSHTARQLANWCVEYYDKYKRAPQSDIEGIYFEKLRNKEISEEIGEEIEEDILPDLSAEYEREDKFNVDFLIEGTNKYFTEQGLKLHEEKLKALRQEGRLEEAEELAGKGFRPAKKDLDNDLNLSDTNSLKRVEKAFGNQLKPLVEYPGALGEFINPQLTRGGFIAFMAPEKRGKSYMLLDLAKRGVRQRLNVAFFQVGDMSEAQQLRRLGIHLAKKSDQERYTGKMWEPVKDCIYNQTDECDLAIRECDHGLEGTHAPISPEKARKGLKFNQLVELYKDNPDYKACYNCKKYQSSPWGCSWINPIDVGSPLEQMEAVNLFEEYFVQNKRRFMLSTHANNTLTVKGMENKLDYWYRRFGFVADLIALDYADLLVSNERDFRHRQDDIWKNLRSLSEQRHVLLATATQADAKSYESGLLKLSNFTEDKRKYAHTTAIFGLNQDPKGREKEIGIMRLNCLVAREGDFNPNWVVHVLQNLKRGQPVLTSYW